MEQHGYQLLFQVHPLPIWVYDRATLRFLEVNEAAVREYGYTRDEFLAMRITDIRPEEDVPSLLAEVASERGALRHASVWRHRVKSGEVVQVEITSHTVQFQGRPAVVVCVQNVTERVRAEAQRRLLATIVETSQDAIIGFTTSGRIMSWNRGAERLYGYTAGEALGRSIAMLVPDGRGHEHPFFRDQLLRGEPVVHFETKRRRKDGRIVPVALTLSPITDESGTTIGFSGVSRDMTEQKIVERALRESEEQFRRIAETISEVFWIAEADRGRIMYVSAAYEQVWGRTCDSVYANPHSFLEAIHPFDHERVLRDLDTQREGKPFDHEYRIIRPDGEVRWIWDRGYPVPNGDGTATTYVGTALDVTDRLNAQATSRELAERMRFALESAQVGVWEVNLQTHAAYWSETCERMHGLAPGTFGKKMDGFLACVHVDDRTAVQSAIERAIRERTRAEMEYRLAQSDGPDRWMRSTAQFTYDDSGAPLRSAGVVTDVTERRMLEEQLRQSQKMEAIGQLAGGVAHDFNNLLTAILGYTRMLSSAMAPNDPRRRDVDEIRKAGERAAGLTNQLLAFSRRQMLQPTVINLNELVRDASRMLQRLIGEHIELSTDLAADIGTVVADRTQIEQVIMNLTVNARDAMATGGRLTISTANVDLDRSHGGRHVAAKPGPYVMLAVGDTGAGMDEGTQRRLFEPFFTTKERGRGTGLGLATVYGIVKQSGGYTFVYSEPDHGSVFKIYLPRATAAQAVPSPQEPAALPTMGSETVLVVEDEAAVRFLTKLILERAGYRVLDAATPAMAETQPIEEIDVLVTDVIMPGASGPALFDKLSARRPSLKVLYMSGYTDDMMGNVARLAPANVFLQKPFSDRDLLRKVRQALDSGRDRQMSVSDNPRQTIGTSA